MMFIRINKIYVESCPYVDSVGMKPQKYNFWIGFSGESRDSFHMPLSKIEMQNSGIRLCRISGSE